MNITIRKAKKNPKIYSFPSRYKNPNLTEFRGGLEGTSHGKEKKIQKKNSLNSETVKLKQKKY